ncbi:MAG: hypothetical protein ACE5JD_02245 [Candidatus Methylomirabilia bacterium]
MKNNEWVIAQSFERVHEVVSAINTLSIRAKLTLAGIDDSSRDDDVRKARMHLVTFLDRFEAVVQDAERHRDGTVLGADPRLGQLAQRFLSVKGKWPCPPGLYTASFPQVRTLVLSRRFEDQKDLINCLRDLRLLLEQHAHSDISRILGDV